MNTTPDNTATTWRDISDELTDRQRAQLDYWEQHPELPPQIDGKVPATPDDHRETLLRMAREDAARNAVADRFADVPTPSDATSVSDWIEWEGDTHARFIGGTAQQVQHLSVDIDGIQYADGTIRRAVRVLHGEHDNGEMGAVLARKVAVALLKAADEIEQLANR